MSGCYCTAPATTGNLCTEHLGKLRMDLWRAPETLRQLDVTITGQAKQGGGGNGGTPDVFNETASDRRQDLMVVLRSAAHAADPGGSAQEPTQLTARALSNLQGLARDAGVHTIAQDLTEELRKAESVMDRAEEKISYGSCSCGVELIAPKSRDRAQCRNLECGAVWDVHQLRAFRHVAALDKLVEHVGTVREITHLLKSTGHQVTERTVNYWTERKANPLTPCGERSGRKLYRFDDARKLADERRKTSLQTH